MQKFSVRINRRHDGLMVAKIPSLSRAVGYGLDAEEALFELVRRLRGEAKDAPAPTSA